MEESIKDAILATFDLNQQDLRLYSPLTLAYIGDDVFDLVIRTMVVGKGETSANQLHLQTSAIVKAHTQALLADAIAPKLTEIEADVYRRGRNAKSHTIPKNATVADYRSATGFEALVGYLYLMNEEKRLLALIHYGLEQLDLL